LFFRLIQFLPLLHSRRSVITVFSYVNFAYNFSRIDIHVRIIKMRNFLSISILAFVYLL